MLFAHDGLNSCIVRCINIQPLQENLRAFRRSEAVDRTVSAMSARLSDVDQHAKPLYRPVFESLSAQLSPLKNAVTARASAVLQGLRNP